MVAAFFYNFKSVLFFALYNNVWCTTKFSKFVCLFQQKIFHFIAVTKSGALLVFVTMKIIFQNNNKATN
jgi:hypothetical protein